MLDIVSADFVSKLDTSKLVNFSQLKNKLLKFVTFDVSMLLISKEVSE